MSKKNSEGYYDLTAYGALKPIMQENAEMDKKAHNLVNVVKFIVDWAGFEVVGRIQIRHKASGKEYR